MSGPERSAPEREQDFSPGYANYVLAVLLVVYIFNFVDRQILSILAGPIQSELGLDDAEMGLLGGIAFAALYSVLGVPLAGLLIARFGWQSPFGQQQAEFEDFLARCEQVALNAFGKKAQRFRVGFLFLSR